jgi:hypothetical protein
MLIAQSPNPSVFPQCSRLTANLASAEGLVCGDFDALANGFIPTTVRVKAQAAKFLLYLQDLKLGSGRPLISMTNGSKSSQGRQRISNQPLGRSLPIWAAQIGCAQPI